MTNRTEIPLQIKRNVRARCGFGCVVCGAQPYEYAHIEDYGKVQCHEEHNITLLCKHHHGEDTLSMLPKDQIIRADREPFNLSTSRTQSRYLFYSGKNVVVRIGGSTFSFDNLPEGFEFVALEIDDKAIISFKAEEEHLFLNFIAHDKNNNVIVEIINNEIIHSTAIWDVEWSANKLIFREGSRRILLKMCFLPPNIINIQKGIIHYNDTDILIDNDILFIANNKSVFGRGSTTNCKVGISIRGMTSYVESWKQIKSEFRKAKKKVKKELLKLDKIK